MRYNITGEPMPVVICHLDKDESMITESGAMVWMSPNMQMETVGGGIGKVFGRMFSGERLFQNVYTARGGEGLIAFANSFPGTIRAVQVTPDKPIICQKSAFLASTQGVELSVFFQKRFGAGLFGGEGFIMQKVSGNGLVFLELDGSTVEYAQMIQPSVSQYRVDEIGTLRNTSVHQHRLTVCSHQDSVPLSHIEEGDLQT